eukprot:TRINITY_DN33328_c0_g1_i2.p1 TRINITY_DN33328_c0_g1~~TRINITY_DN33328_c0_g1_i2.p1  ORF type:complete len:103 (+),score=16.38 TRINITY_DN33328_c0_g1_i2:357-665(+)
MRMRRCQTEGSEKTGHEEASSRLRTVLDEVAQHQREAAMIQEEIQQAREKVQSQDLTIAQLRAKQSLPASASASSSSSSRRGIPRPPEAQPYEVPGSARVRG